jgi:hypothetical protein
VHTGFSRWRLDLCHFHGSKCRILCKPWCAMVFIALFFSNKFIFKFIPSSYAHIS